MNNTDSDSSDHVRRVVVPQSEMDGLFKTTQRIVEGVPDDALCVSYHTNPERNTLEFIFKSQEFGPVPRGEVIPEYDISVYTETMDVPNEYVPPEALGHTPESSFADSVANWFRSRYGPDSVDQEVYLEEPYWFVDIVVDVGYGTLYIEVENDGGSIPTGVGQALGYAADDPATGIPMVVVPVDHAESEKVAHYRKSGTVVIREYDSETDEFVE